METEALPANIQTILDNHSIELKNLLNEWDSRQDARMGSNVCQKEWLPNYYIKYGVERVANAQKLKRIIHRYKLDLSVAKKYLYHVPGMPNDLSSKNYLVIVKKVVGKTGPGLCLNLEEVKQLRKVAVLANHYDLHPKNYIKKVRVKPILKAKIIIIDTDKYAMPSLEKIKLLKQDWFLHGNRLYDGSGICMNPEIINDTLIKLELPMYSKHENYDEEAEEYLDNQLKRREKLRLELHKKLNKN